jgi:ectoine hydroxylase-related dioxygenase (phytanoyl-CoA dioxygenase family)
MLTAEQITEYREKGYVVPDYRLSDEVLKDIREAHTQLLARHPEFRDNCSALLSHDLRFLNYARDPKILDMVSQLIGPDIALWNMSFFAKPALNGKKTPMHQDGEYWPIVPLATCTVWIAIDEATVENGCLRYIPGSHKQSRLVAWATNRARSVCESAWRSASSPATIFSLAARTLSAASTSLARSCESCASRTAADCAIS